MNIEELREFCLSFPGATEGFPFDEDTLVFKVGNKMFALTSLASGPLRVNLKCDPGKAIELREIFPAVEPGYHMSKKHWNTVEFDGSIDDHQVKQWIRDSYQLIFTSLPKKTREQISKA